ncbi:MAG: aminopeptidase, partial [Thermoplasmatota archaeon]
MSDEKSAYAYQKKSAWNIFSPNQIQQANELCESYKDFLSQAKTEREAIQLIHRIAKKNNANIHLNKHAGAAIIVPGKKPIGEGIKIVISHVDSPRLDLKQIPLFEDKDSNLALLETHYYGGIKKFQWLTIPLALHGIIIKKDGEKLN